MGLLVACPLQFGSEGDDVTERPARIVVLVSGSGTNLQALLDAAQDPGWGGQIAAVGSDRDGIEGLVRAQRHGVPTFIEKVNQYADRSDWDLALTKTVASHDPDVIVLAGFMKLVGDRFLRAFPNRVVNTHPALCPAFPGTTGPADALDYGVKVTGATLFVVDEGHRLQGHALDAPTRPLLSRFAGRGLHQSPRDGAFALLDQYVPELGPSPTAALHVPQR